MVAVLRDRNADAEGRGVPARRDEPLGEPSAGSRRPGLLAASQRPGLVLPSRRRFSGLRPGRLPTAFVLAGGGARGAVQVGMLRALVARGIRADRVYGASVGAINGAGYAGLPTATGMAQLEAVWRGVRGEDVFPPGRVPAPLRFFQARAAVHGNEGLRRVIDSALVFRRLEDATVPLAVVATSLRDGQARWLERGPAVESLLASAAIPALLPPVTIEGEPLVDGGVVDNVPIGRAVADGCRRIVVLLCGPLEFGPPAQRRPVDAVLTGFFIAVHARFLRELELVPPEVELLLCTVDLQPPARYDDFSHTEELLAVGRRNCEALLDFWEAGGVGPAPPLSPPTLLSPVPDPPAGEPRASRPGRPDGARRRGSPPDS